jgi:hypothetical protein
LLLPVLEGGFHNKEFLLEICLRVLFAYATLALVPSEHINVYVTF